MTQKATTEQSVLEQLAGLEKEVTTTATATVTSPKPKHKKPVPVVTLPKVGDTLLKIDCDKTEEYKFEETFTTDDELKIEVVSLKKANKYSYEGLPKQAFYCEYIYKEEYFDSKKNQVVSGKTFRYIPDKKSQTINVEVTNKDGKSLKPFSYKYKVE